MWLAAGARTSSNSVPTGPTASSGRPPSENVGRAYEYSRTNGKYVRVEIPYLEIKSEPVRERPLPVSVPEPLAVGHPRPLQQPIGDHELRRAAERDALIRGADGQEPGDCAGWHGRATGCPFCWLDTCGPTLRRADRAPRDRAWQPDVAVACATGHVWGPDAERGRLKTTDDNRRRRAVQSNPDHRVCRPGQLRAPVVGGFPETQELVRAISSGFKSPLPHQPSLACLFDGRKLRLGKPLKAVPP